MRIVVLVGFITPVLFNSIIPTQAHFSKPTRGFSFLEQLHALLIAQSKQGWNFINAEDGP